MIDELVIRLSNDSIFTSCGGTSNDTVLKSTLEKYKKRFTKTHLMFQSH